MNDRQILFWLLIIGILFYFYIDMKITRLERDVRMHLLLFEKILQQVLPQNNDNQLQSQQPSNEWETTQLAPISKTTKVMRSNTLQAPSSDMDITEIIPTREELTQIMAARTNRSGTTEHFTTFSESKPFDIDENSGNWAPVNF